MRKLTVLIASLAFISLSGHANAHGFQNNRFGSTVGFSNSFYYPSYPSYPSSHRSSYYPAYFTPYYPSNSLIMGITYRNYQSRVGLQNRIYNGRVSNIHRYNGRTYNKGYRQAYSDGYSFGRRSINSNDYRSNRYSNNTCYESYYDRFGNRVERSLPASACRH